MKHNKDRRRGDYVAGMIIPIYRENGSLEGFGRLLEKYETEKTPYTHEGIVYGKLRWKIKWVNLDECIEDLEKEGFITSYNTRQNHKHLQGKMTHRYIPYYICDERAEWGVSRMRDVFDKDRLPRMESKLRIDRFLKFKGKEIY